MHKIAVGELYQAGVTKYHEGIHYNWDKGGNSLALLISNPSPEEIRAVKKGNIEWKLLPYEECLFILVKFEGMPWVDAPYSWWVVPQSRRISPPELKDHESLVIVIVLINAANGIVEAIRLVALPQSFSKALVQAVENQMKHPTSYLQYNQKIDEVYATYQSSEAMIKNSTQ